MTKVVIFNAPPGAGKDEVVKWLKVNHDGVVHVEFKNKLISLTKEIYCISDDQWERMYTREEKETPQDALDGKTPREALIHVSEIVIKPNFGFDYFGKAAAKSIHEGKVNAFSDGGFLQELEPVVDRIGAENVYVVRVHRPGYNFNIDSRNYLKNEDLSTLIGIPGDNIVDIQNDYTLEAYFRRVEKQLIDWGVLNGKQNRSC